MPSTPRSSKVPLSFAFFYHKSVCISLLYILSLIIIVWLYFLKNDLLKLLAVLVVYGIIVSQRRHICNC